MLKIISVEDNQKYESLHSESKPGSTGDLRTVFKNLIYIFFIFLLCGLVALGFVLLFLHPVDSNCTDSKNSTKPTKLDYIWPENVEKLIHDIVEHNMHVTNDDRAVLLKTELMRFDTDDVFYIIVYDATDGPNNHAFYGDKSQYITSFNPGKCNVVVYRSHFWKSSPQRALNVITKEVEETCQKGIAEKSDYSKDPEQLSKNFHDTKFIGLIGKEHDVAIRSANSFGRVWGPGYWHIMQVFRNNPKHNVDREFYLIAGYK